MTAPGAGSSLGVGRAGVGVVAVLALREATLSTHQRVDPGSQVESWSRPQSKGAEPVRPLDEMVEALL